MDFDTWIRQVQIVSNDPDFDIPTPDFKMEYEEWVDAWKRGLTPQQAWDEVVATFPDPED